MTQRAATAPMSPRKALLLKLGAFLSFQLLLVGCIAIHLLLGQFLFESSSDERLPSVQIWKRRVSFRSLLSAST